MVFGAALSALALTGCSDTWDDHYDVAQGGEGASLWQVISQDAELSNFATVLRATGYDQILASSQVMTVFAPTNANFSAAEAEELIAQYNDQNTGADKRNFEDNQTIKEFVRNHIALFNRSVVEGRQDTIRLLNGKYINLTKGTYGGSQILNNNKLYANGMLFKLDKPAKYTPNVFEAIEKTEGLDSVAAFFNSYNRYYFNAAQSVPGNLNDKGQTEYLDSVKTLQNEMMYSYGRLDREDSTYLVIAPTNDEWNRLIEKYSTYFQYTEDVERADSMMWTMPRAHLLAGCTFNKTDNHEWQSLADSAVSTNAVNYRYRQSSYGYEDIPYGVFDKPQAAGGVLDPAAVAVRTECSNGTLLAMKQWNIDPLQSFVFRPILEGESTSSITDIDDTKTSRPTSVAVPKTSPFYNEISNHRYVQILPAGTVQHDVTFNITGQLSNLPYDVYIIFAPAIAGDSLASEAQRLTTKLRVKLDWQDLDGKWQKKPLQVDNVIPEPDVVHRYLIAEKVTFPTCTYNSGGKTQVKLNVGTRVSNSELNNKKYNRNILVDCIVLVPHLENQ